MQAPIPLTDLLPDHPQSSGAAPAGEPLRGAPDMRSLWRAVEHPAPRSHLVSRVVRLCVGHELSARALQFAAQVLAGRNRPSCHEPALLHAMRVAGVVAFVFHATDPVLIAGALLHDVLEDSETDPDVLEAEFGDQVLDIVVLLTKPALFAKPDRKRIYADALLVADPGVVLVKLADYCVNLEARRGSRRLAKTWRGAAGFCALLRQQRTLRGCLRAAVEHLEGLLAELGPEAHHVGHAPALPQAA